MENNQRIRNGRILRNLSVYAGVAWGAVQFIDFIIDKYSLNPVWLDIALFFAVIGSLVILVLSWYHSEPGRQEIAPTEVRILGALATIGVLGMLAIAAPNIFNEFERANGFHLSVAFQSAMRSETSQCGFAVRLEGPLPATRSRRAGPFFMSPRDFLLVIPGVRLSGERVPVRIRAATEDEFYRVILVAPSRPDDLDSLLQHGVDHDFGRIEAPSFVLQIDRAFTIVDKEDSATINIRGPFALNGDRDCEPEIFSYIRKNRLSSMSWDL